MLIFGCSNVKARAVTDVEDGYLRGAMLPVYANAAARSGKQDLGVEPSMLLI